MWTMHTYGFGTSLSASICPTNYPCTQPYPLTPWSSSRMQNIFPKSKPLPTCIAWRPGTHAGAASACYCKTKAGCYPKSTAAASSACALLSRQPGLSQGEAADCKGCSRRACSLLHARYSCIRHHHSCSRCPYCSCR